MRRPHAVTATAACLLSALALLSAPAGAESTRALRHAAFPRAAHRAHRGRHLARHPLRGRALHSLRHAAFPRRAHRAHRAHHVTHQHAQRSALELQVLGDINAIRASNGLGPLHLSAALSAAAREHSRQMAARGYFSHSSADGTAFWQRISHFYRLQGFRFWAVGENLLWSSPSVDAQGAVRMWMNSPEHRANLLNGQWHEIGLSAVHAGSAPGVYGGRQVTIVTTDFGVRK